MKKLFLIFIFSLFLSLNSYSKDSLPLYGDINGDNKITSTDYALMDRYISKQITLSEQQIKYADLNADTIVSNSDKDLLSNYIYGLIFSFPVENNLSLYPYTPQKNKIDISLTDKSTLNLKIKFPKSSYKIINKGSISTEENDTRIKDYTSDKDYTTTTFKSFQAKITKKIIIQDIQLEYDRTTLVNEETCEEIFSYNLGFDSSIYDLEIVLNFNNSEIYNFKQWEPYTPSDFDIFNNIYNGTDYSNLILNFPDKNYRVKNLEITKIRGSYNQNKLKLTVEKQNFGLPYEGLKSFYIDFSRGPKGFITEYYANNVLLATHNDVYAIPSMINIVHSPLNINVDYSKQNIDFNITIPKDLKFSSSKLDKIDLGDGFNTYICDMAVWSPRYGDYLTRYYPKLIIPEFKEQKFNWSQNIPFTSKNRIIVTSVIYVLKIIEFDNEGNVTNVLEKEKLKSELYPNNDLINKANSKSSTAVSTTNELTIYR